jgi:CHAT domain-containing protein/tetratricopeptide (TPR) repeat protein
VCRHMWTGSDRSPVTGSSSDEARIEAELEPLRRAQAILFGSAPDAEEALALLRRTARLWPRSRSPEVWAIVQLTLAQAYLRRTSGTEARNVRMAIEKAKVGLDVLRGLPPGENLANAELVLGSAYARRVEGRPKDNLDQALDWFGASVRTSVALGNVEQVLPALMAGADILRRQHADGRTENIERAIELFRFGADAYRRTTGAVPPEILHNLGLAYLGRLTGSRTENLETAISCLEQALAGTNQDRDPRSFALTQRELAQARSRRLRGPRAANLERAVDELRAAASVYERIGAKYDLALTLHALGHVQSDRGNFPDALGDYRRALALAREASAGAKTVAAIQNSLAHTLLANPAVTPADEQEAAELYDQALDVVTRLGLLDDRLMILQNVAEAAMVRGRWRAAEAALRTAIDTGDRLLAMAWSDVGRRLEVSTTSRLFSRAAYCALRLGDYDHALATLERGHARLLTAALRVRDADVRRLPATAQRRFRAARSAVERLEQQEVELLRSSGEAFAHLRPLEEAREIFDRVVSEIRAHHRWFMPEGLSTAELLRLVPKDGALVAPLATAEGGACFVIPYGRSRVAAEDVLLLDGLTTQAVRDILVGTRTQAGWMEAYRRVLADRSSATRVQWEQVITTGCEHLWNLLMGRVDARLREIGLQPNAEVVVMPQGGLGVLPLHAATRKVDETWHPFLDDWTVRYAPSGYSLLSTARRPPRRRSLLAVVDPGGNLPAAPAEVHAVARHFSKGATEILKGGDVREETVRTGARNRSYVHFACHASYGWDDPMASGLEMAADDDLNLGEVIAHFRLERARLVALSACETGVNEHEIQPDEYVGLPAGFLAAGAQAVLSSLWSVSDLATCLLISRFYALHIKRNATPAAALRDAQRWLRDATIDQLADDPPWQGLAELPVELKNDWALVTAVGSADPTFRPFEHPFCWAAFTLTGT